MNLVLLGANARPASGADPTIEKDTLIVFEGPDDQLRVFLDKANKTLAIWGGEALWTPKNSRRLFMLENFYPRSLESHLGDLDPMIDPIVDQTFERAAVRCRSNTITNLEKVVKDFIAPQHPFFKIMLKHVTNSFAYTYIYEGGHHLYSNCVNLREIGDINAWLES